ncbi:hypothetical protein N0V82_010865, partial [Gnomoniopsis sp. IMI 355080]
MGGIQQGYDTTGQSNAQTQSRGSRQMRGRLSLQVPERIGAKVRLATPQGQQQMPTVMVTGAMTTAGHQASTMTNPQNQHSFHTSMTGPDMHMMDPFSSGAAQDMYDMLYQQQQAQQHQHSQHIQNAQQTTQDTGPLYSTNTTSTHHMASTNPPASPAPTTLFHHPTPASLAESASGDTRPAGVLQSRETGNRTNLDSLEALLTYELLSAEWMDVQGGQIAACGIEEAVAVAREIVENAERVASG